MSPTVNGWFPSLNSRGDVVSGNTSVWIKYFNGLIENPGIGRGPKWLGFNNIIYLYDPSTEALIYDLNVQKVTSRIDIHPGYNIIESDGDKLWAGFVQSGDGRVSFYSWNDLIQSISGACCPKLYKGNFAYLHPYQASTRTLYVNGNPIVSGIITNFAFGPEIVWRVATGTYTGILRARNGIDISLRNDEDILKCLDFMGRNWVLTNSQKGLLLYPIEDKFGYNITEDMFNADVISLGNQFIIVASDSKGNQKIWNSEGKIPVDLTKLGSQQPPIIVPTPIPVPKPEPKPMVDHTDIVRAERNKYPSKIDDSTCFKIINAVLFNPVVSAEGWGLVKAPSGGRGISVDGQNYRVQRIMKKDGTLNQILGSSGSGDAIPEWTPGNAGELDVSNWAPPVLLASNPNPIPTPIPNTTSQDVLNRLTKLEGDVEALRSSMLKDGDNIALQSNRGRFLRDDWGDNLGHFDRSEAGSGELYRLVKK